MPNLSELQRQAKAGIGGGGLMGSRSHSRHVSVAPGDYAAWLHWRIRVLKRKIRRLGKEVRRKERQLRKMKGEETDG